MCIAGGIVMILVGLYGMGYMDDVWGRYWWGFPTCLILFLIAAIGFMYVLVGVVVTIN